MFVLALLWCVHVRYMHRKEMPNATLQCKYNLQFGCNCIFGSCLHLCDHTFLNFIWFWFECIFDRKRKHAHWKQRQFESFNSSFGFNILDIILLWKYIKRIWIKNLKQKCVIIIVCSFLFGLFIHYIRFSNQIKIFNFIASSLLFYLFTYSLRIY